MFKASPLFCVEGLLKETSKTNAISVIIHTLLPKLDRSTMNDLPHAVSTQLSTLAETGVKAITIPSDALYVESLFSAPLSFVIFGCVHFVEEITKLSLM
eukprot:6473458-Heterocapsa_arctica.AAC.1